MAGKMVSGATTSVAKTQIHNLVVKEVASEERVKVVFPSGKNVIPTYDLGIPLSPEEYLIKP